MIQAMNHFQIAWEVFTSWSAVRGANKLSAPVPKCDALRHTQMWYSPRRSFEAAVNHLFLVPAPLLTGFVTSGFFLTLSDQLCTYWFCSKLPVVVFSLTAPVLAAGVGTLSPPRLRWPLAVQLCLDSIDLLWQRAKTQTTSTKITQGQPQCITSGSEVTRVYHNHCFPLLT